MQGRIGEIRMYAGNIAPENWMFCNGQILPKSMNIALYITLGSGRYYGQTDTHFMLPNINGRAVVGAGTGQGLSTYSLGAKTGKNKVTILQNQMPAHTHSNVLNVTAAVNLLVSDQPGTSSSPVGNYLAASATGMAYSTNSSSGEKMKTTPLTFSEGSIKALETGGGEAHNNLQPYLGINFIICTHGTAPTQ
jgi:microcystin-dependent protein